MATVYTEGMKRGRCGYCIYRRFEKGVDVATVFTKGMRKGLMWLLYLQKV